MDKPHANANSQDSPRPELGGSHHLPPYSILFLATGPTPKYHFVLRLPNGNLEIPKIKTPIILEAHNFVCEPSIEMKFKEKL
jgi:hypothetical protein